MSHPENSFKCFPKLRVEDCVDDGIKTGVDVAQEGGSLEGNIAGGGVEVVLDTEGIQDVAGEEGDPADKETGCKY